MKELDYIARTLVYAIDPAGDVSHVEIILPDDWQSEFGERRFTIKGTFRSNYKGMKDFHPFTFEVKECEGLAGLEAALEAASSDAHAAEAYWYHTSESSEDED